MNVSLGRICRLFGVTRQAYYQYFWRQEDLVLEHNLILDQVIEIRGNHRRMGTRKLYELLEPFMLTHQIKMGRDALFDLLSCHNLLVKRRRRTVKTTNSFHYYRKYPNLVKEFNPTGRNQLWVSDITYWKIGGKHVYISLVTDAFSRKVVGYQLLGTLEAEGPIRALKKAISGLLSGPDDCFELIHHSDRGIQYCSKEYVKVLNKHQVKISMTESGDPRENALAERVNGILKDEYLYNYSPKSIEEAKKILDQTINLYNKERPHMSIGNLVPEKVHELNLNTEQLWKGYYKENPTIVNQ